MIVNVAVCDDDKEMLGEETELIRKVLEEKNIEYQLSVFDNPKALLTSEIIYDMVFLDIEMEEMNGVDLAYKIAAKKKDCLFFFITNHSVYLDKAFDINAVRYFVKPVDENRLSDGIDSAMNRMEDKYKKITVKSMSKTKVSVATAEIIYISNVGRHTHMVTTNQGEFEVWDVFSGVKNRIERQVSYFAMPHQSFYVNLRFVTNHTKELVTMSYAGRDYTACMARRRYRGFEEKFFGIVNMVL